MNVEKIMTKKVSSCSANDSLCCPARIMWERDCGLVPVVADTGAVVGVITDRDICMAALHQGRSLSEIKVESAMAHDPICCRPTDSVASVEKLMSDRQVRRIPVVDVKGNLVGIVSLNDLVLCAQPASGKPAPLSRDEVARTMAEVCRHREVVAV